MESVVLQGHGTYAVPLVGESHCQDALKGIHGPQAGPKKATASLIPEADNPHDPNAVRVEINGMKVGHLPREMAKIYRELMAGAGQPQAVATCEAHIEPPEGRDTPPPSLLDPFYRGDIYEVFLDIFDDKSIHAILEGLGKRAVQVEYDTVPQIDFAGARFCLTGKFNQPKDALKAAIESRGGAVAENVSGKLQYLVVGSAGSAEWKYGTFGTKIEKALLIKEDDDTALSIISEAQLNAALTQAP
jgi:hypothetical protein